MPDLTLHTPSGKPIEITFGRYLDRVSATAHLPTLGLTGSIRNATAYPLPSLRDGATHYLILDGPKSAQLGISSEQADRLADTVAQMQAEIDTDPGVILRRRMEQRQNLVLEITGLDDQAQAARERAHEQDFPAGLPRYDTPERAAAVAALREFDRRYPDVKQAIGRERAEALRRHMWD